MAITTLQEQGAFSALPPMAKTDLAMTVMRRSPAKSSCRAVVWGFASLRGARGAFRLGLDGGAYTSPSAQGTAPAPCHRLAYPRLFARLSRAQKFGGSATAQRCSDLGENWFCQS